MEWNPKKCNEMLKIFLKYNIETINPIYVFGAPIATVSSFKPLGLTLLDFHSDNVSY